MRRHWHVPNASVFIGIWGLGWIPVSIIAATLEHKCGESGCGMNGPISTAFIVVLAVWFGPVLVPATLLGLAWLVREAWKNRPRRIWKPVTSDLREIHRCPGDDA